jgi:hypothetical protein
MPTAPTIVYSIVIGMQTSKEAAVEAAAMVVAGEGNLALRDVVHVTLIRIRLPVGIDPALGTTAAHMTLDVGLGPGVVDRVQRTKACIAESRNETPE